jgi:hypothetical protein
MEFQKEIELLVSMLNHPAGYDLDLFGILGIRTTSDGVSVEYELHEDEEYPPGCCECSENERKIAVFDFPFGSLENAVRFFVEIRHARQIGLDFEHNEPNN